MPKRKLRVGSFGCLRKLRIETCPRQNPKLPLRRREGFFGFPCCAGATCEHPGVVTSTARSSPTTDAALLRRYRATRDEESFARLVSRHAAAVRAVALRTTGNASAAEDVAQATFLVLIGRTGPAMRSATLRGDLRPWLAKTCRFCAANWRRSEARRRRREQVAATPESVDPSEPGELGEQVAAAVAALRRRDRRLIELRHLDGLAWPDVAARLNLDPPAARVAGGRALDRLRDLLLRRGITATTATVAASLSALVAKASLRSAAPTPAAFSLAKGTLLMLKLKTIAVLSTAALLGGAGGGLLYAGQENPGSEAAAAKSATTTASDVNQQSLPYSLSGILSDGTQARVVAIGDGERWWSAYGELLEDVEAALPDLAIGEGEVSRYVIVEVVGRPDTEEGGSQQLSFGSRPTSPSVRFDSIDDGSRIVFATVLPREGDAPNAELNVLISAGVGEWRGAPAGSRNHSWLVGSARTEVQLHELRIQNPAGGGLRPAVQFFPRSLRSEVRIVRTSANDDTGEVMFVPASRPYETRLGEQTFRLDYLVVPFDNQSVQPDESPGRFSLFYRPTETIEFFMLPSIPGGGTPEVQVR